MSGHSKWKNIMHKKENTDSQRAKIFTKIGKEIAMAVRDGGADPNTNGKLHDLIAQAKAKGSLCLSFSLGKIKKNPGNTIISNSMSYPATFIYS